MQQPRIPPHLLTPEEREEQRLEHVKRNQAAREWLQELDQGDRDEQRETWELIERMLREEPGRL